MPRRFWKKNINESLNNDQFEELLEVRLRRKWLYEANIMLITKFQKHRKEAIKMWNFSIWLEDEVTFEITKKTNRILMSKWERFRLKLKELLHEWQKMCWFLNNRWDTLLYEMWWNFWKHFLEVITKFWEETEKDELKIVIVDNNTIHFTIDVLLECLRNNVLLIKLPRYSPQLNPIEQLRKMVKRYWRMKYNELKSFIIWIKDYVKENNFIWLVKKYIIKFFATNL